MTEEQIAINRLMCGNTAHSCKADYIKLAISALENQKKIKEIIANANQWSKGDVVVKAQAFCDIEKILRGDEQMNKEDVLHDLEFIKKGYENLLENDPEKFQAIGKDVYFSVDVKTKSDVYTRFIQSLGIAIETVKVGVKL